MGKSGRAILRTLAAGLVRPEALADRAVGSLRKKIPVLILALEGNRATSTARPRHPKCSNADSHRRRDVSVPA